MRPREVAEIKELGAVAQLALELCVGNNVGRHECRCGYRQEVLREPLVLEDFRPRDAHEFDRATHEPDVVDVRGPIRSGAGETHVGLIRAGLGENALSQRRRDVVVDDKIAADDPMRLCVPGALVVSRRPMHAHVGPHVDNDRVETLRFSRQRLLLRKREPVVWAPQVDQPLQDRGARFPEQRIPRRTKERVEAPLEMQHGDKDPVNEPFNRQPGAAIGAQNVFKNSMSARLSVSLSPGRMGPVCPGSR